MGLGVTDHKQLTLHLIPTLNSETNKTAKLPKGPKPMEQLSFLNLNCTPAYAVFWKKTLKNSTISCNNDIEQKIKVVFSYLDKSLNPALNLSLS